MKSVTRSLLRRSIDRCFTKPAIEGLEGRRLFATFIVTTTADTGAGSLREAITLANADSDADVINFNIPGAGVQRIQPATALPAIVSQVAVDGYSQPGAKANTQAVGSDAVLLIELNGDVAYGTGLALSQDGPGHNAAGSSVRGLIVNGFLDGIEVSSSLYTVSNVTVAGNWIGTTADGQSDDGNDSTGVYVAGDVENVHIGGVLPADRNVISGNTTQIYLFNHNGGTVIENNYIGLNPAGTTHLHYDDNGINISSSSNNTIGGTTPASRNVIVADSSAVISGSDGKFNRIIGNYIGTAADGVSKPLNQRAPNYGVSLYNDVTYTAIGGDSSSEGNVIAFVNIGVSIDGSDERVVSNPIRHNSIFNTTKPIELRGGSASTSYGNGDVNDYGDSDVGGNHKQNFAAITSATTNGDKTTVGGYLNSRIARGYVVDFFASPADGKPYAGQAKTFLGSVQVVTDGYGNATFSADLPAVPAGTYLTNTVTSLATFPFGDTSQVSPAAVVTAVTPPPPQPVLPGLSVANVSTTEGNSGTKVLTFTVKLSAAATTAVSVLYNTQDGTAKTGDNDYLAKNGTLTFAPGELTKTVSITIKGDTKVEANESFNLLLSSATGATISDGVAVGTITNDDAPPPLPKLSVGGYTTTEGHSGTKAFTFKVTLDKSSTSAITVKYNTANDSALAGSDYTAASGTLTFAAGETSKTITIYVKGDKSKEADEKFFVLLTTPTNAAIAVGKGTGLIKNDD